MADRAATDLSPTEAHPVVMKQDQGQSQQQRFGGEVAPDLSPEDFKKLKRSGHLQHGETEAAARIARLASPEDSSKPEKRKRQGAPEAQASKPIEFQADGYMDLDHYKAMGIRAARGYSDEEKDMDITSQELWIGILFRDAVKSSDPERIQAAIGRFKNHLEQAPSNILYASKPDGYEPRVFKLPYPNEKKYADIYPVRVIENCMNRLAQRQIGIGIARKDFRIVDSAISQSTYSTRDYKGKSEEHEVLSVETYNHYLNALFRLAVQEKDPRKIEQIQGKILGFLDDAEDKLKDPKTKLHSFFDHYKIIRPTGSGVEQSWVNVRRKGILFKPNDYDQEGFYDQENNSKENKLKTQEELDREWVERVKDEYLKPIKDKLAHQVSAF